MTRRLLVLALLVLAVATSGCPRKVVVTPDQISRYNDADWHVRSAAPAAPASHK